MFNCVVWMRTTPLFWLRNVTQIYKKFYANFNSTKRPSRRLFDRNVPLQRKNKSWGILPLATHSARTLRFQFTFFYIILPHGRHETRLIPPKTRLNFEHSTRIFIRITTEHQVVRAYRSFASRRGMKKKKKNKREKKKKVKILESRWRQVRKLRRKIVQVAYKNVYLIYASHMHAPFNFLLFRCIQRLSILSHTELGPNFPYYSELLGCVSTY